MTKQPIILKNVRVHNLKGVNLTLSPHQLIVFTGVSGSGKSSLAFYTIYVEGQRRYVESLSTYARRSLGSLPKPDAELISGISPTIAIEQKKAGHTPRSTVGTVAGIHDYLRLLFARVGTPHCPVSGEKIAPLSRETILSMIEKFPEKTPLIILAPYLRGRKGEFKELFDDLKRKGFTKVRLSDHFLDLSEEIVVDKKKAHDIDLVIDRITIDKKNGSRLAESVYQALEIGKGMIIVFNHKTKEETLFSESAYAKESNLSYPPLEPQDFSFNHPKGMCPTCEGLGTTQDFNLDLIIDPELSIAEDCCKVASPYATVKWGNIYNNLARIYHFKVDTPWKKLSKEAKEVFLYGSEKKWLQMRFVHPEKKSSWSEYVSWKGVLEEARKRYLEATSMRYKAKMGEWMHETLCPACQGARIKPYPAATLLSGKTIQQVTAMPIEEVLLFFASLSLSPNEKKIAENLLIEITRRLRFLHDVGLHYLSLDRTSPSLSGGEGQRVKLSSHIGSKLVGSTYILDEPSIGLHPRDNKKLIESLIHLKDLGNTVIVVEHDQEMMEAADHVVDVGPGAGSEGGEILAEGSIEDLLASPRSLTGAYLGNRLSIPVPKQRRKGGKEKILIQGASHHNLKSLDVSIPLHLLVAITGVSGSGKSSLITDILYPALVNLLHGGKQKVGKHKKIDGGSFLEKVIGIDQTPIGRTPRSNPSTYIKLFDDIRDLFSKLPESLAQGYCPGRFSFNVLEGSCPECKGMGMLRVDMDFMEDAWVTCTVCHGKRFDAKTLSVLYKGKSIFDILEMSVKEAHLFFENIPKIKQKLEFLLQVGLGYLSLGQSSTTLSGGEAQRIKLSKEMMRPSQGKTLYILDEPTTGLHFDDIAKLSKILHHLANEGNSVVVIEHNMDLIKTADHVIDLGPEGGQGGGKIVGEGTPEELAKLKTPTGLALSEILFPKKKKKPQGKPSSYSPLTALEVKGCKQNNLKNLSLSIPRDKISIFTGPSGSGKSSLVFETIYAEGQRRYIESLAPYARQFVKQMPKADVEEITGLSPAIAIEQKKHAGNPRSTMGTMTEIYDFLRLLYAHVGVAHAPETGEKIVSISKEFIVDLLMQKPEGSKAIFLSPLEVSTQEGFKTMKEELVKRGFLRLRFNGTYYELEEEIPFEAYRKNELLLVIDRFNLRPGIEKRIFTAIEEALKVTKEHFVVHIEEEDFLFHLTFADPTTGKSYPPITPHTFSFNSEEGMCPDCLGLGFTWGANLLNEPQLLKLTSLQLISSLWKEYENREPEKLLLSFLKEEGIDPDIPLYKLPVKHLQYLLNGTSSQKKIERKGLFFEWRGLNQVFEKIGKGGQGELKESILPLLSESLCLSCKGERLHSLARHVEIEGITIGAFCKKPISEALSFIKKLILPKKKGALVKEVLSQLTKRLSFLFEIGLGYLSLDRSAPTLSGGEAQRIHLARQLGSGLTGSLYVLDEPTIGLHPHNASKLNEALKHLCQLGNTLLIVEHDPLTMTIGDYLYDFGPSGGKGGGKLLASGTLEQIKKNPHSLTGNYLSSRKKIPFPAKRRIPKDWIAIKNATKHNLKNLSLTIPIGVFTGITGVSGSGKSTLINEVLKKGASLALTPFQKKDKVIVEKTELSGFSPFKTVISLDQKPVGHTIRADVASYTDLLTPLRHFFAELPEAKAYGLLPRNFSYNHLKGMCRTCWGLGFKTIQMQFLPPLTMVCEACHGERLNPLSLKVSYKGKSLGKLLQLTVEEAKEFLPPHPKMHQIIEILLSVGLGYLSLGQSIPSLSGGEAQRLRLATELAKRSSGKILYLFDEPTIGLHFSDLEKLLPIFHTLVDRGHTVIIIEHNLDLIKNCDYLVDLGPEAGAQGGEIVAVGTPEEVANHPTSYTGKFLLPLL